MKQCPLCFDKVNAFHKKSHLIPEWMYKDCYDKKHKILNVNLDLEYINKRQKGFYDEIICPKCEKESQAYDHYASLILTERSLRSNEYKSIKRLKKETIYKGKRQSYSYWENIEFNKFQKFVYACLLRTHLSMVKKKECLLINKHFNKIREIYKNDKTLDDKSYPVMGVKYLNNDGFENIIYLPFKKKKQGHHLIEFAGAGYFFWVFVSSHKKPNYVNGIRLQQNGSMYLLEEYIEKCGTFKKVGPILRKGLWGRSGLI